MAAGSEGVTGFAFVEQDGNLAFANRQVGAVLDFAGTAFGNAVNKFLPAFIKPFDIFEKNNIIHSHGVTPSE